MRSNGIYRIAIILLLFGTSGLYAQNWKQTKADEFYERFDYVRAIPLYESIPKKTPEIYRRLGHAYYVMGNYKKALKAYEKLIGKGEYIPDDVYQYAYFLLMNKKYAKAKKWLAKYARLRPRDSRARRFMLNPGYYKELIKANPKTKIHNLNINSVNADFGPAIYHDSLIVFASSRPTLSKNWKGNDQPYLDLYYSKIIGEDDLSEPAKFPGKINGKYHDGPASFDKPGITMVLTRNIYGQKKLLNNKLWLYQSMLDNNGRWSEPFPLHFNDTTYSCGHPALNNNGTVMYFTSDAPGGFGGMDLYMVRRLGDSAWGEPKNLGPVVNTEGNEMFPVFDEDQGYLFFASDGLPGLGGLDVFVVKVNANGDMSEPVNLGAPINSNYDDFALVYRNNESGFFSSNRIGGKGSDDLYGFKNLHDFKSKARIYYLNVQITDSLTGKPIPGEVVVTENNLVKSKAGITPPQMHKMQIFPRHTYQVRVTSEGYLPAVMHFTATGDRDVTIKKIPLVNKRWKEMCAIRIKPLYYDLDKYYIRSADSVELDKIVRLMNQYPEMKLEVASYTDSRATFEYNMDLSHKRTMSVVNYLISRGIDSSRLVPKWFGETHLVNGCADGVECTEEQHQLNRRTEFSIINCRPAAKAKAKEKEE